MKPSGRRQIILPQNHQKYQLIIGGVSIKVLLELLTASGWMFLQGVLQPVGSQVQLLAHKDFAQWMFSIRLILFLKNFRFHQLQRFQYLIGLQVLLPMCCRKELHPALIILHFIAQHYKVPAIILGILMVLHGIHILSLSQKVLWLGPKVIVPMSTHYPFHRDLQCLHTRVILLTQRMDHQ